MRARSITACIAVLVVLALSLPVARDVGYQWRIAACDGSEDCGPFASSAPVCTYFGRDRVSAQETFAFAQQAAGGETRITQFGDGSAEVVVDAEGDTDAAQEVYRFHRYEDAQRWVLDRAPELSAVVDAAAGPALEPVRAGHISLVRALGLDHETAVLPNARQVRAVDPEAPGSHGALRRATDDRAARLTVTMPLAQIPASDLRDMAERLGLAESLTYSVTLDGSGEPVSLSVAGPAAESWSLDALRSAAAPQAAEATTIVEGREFDVRRYSLDLRRGANLAAVTAVTRAQSFDARGAVPMLESGTDVSRAAAGLYEQLGNRFRDDAVYISATHRTAAAAADEEAERAEAALAARTLLDGSDPSAREAESRIVTADTADLAIAGSLPEPLMSCDRPGDDEDEAP